MNTIGEIFKVTTWGESHGAGIGAVIDGCPAGIDISVSSIQEELDRRKPGQSKVTTQRGEEDKVQVFSGVFEGRSTGAPISLLIRNKDADSSKYDNLRNISRPGHADYTYTRKYGLRDHRGGGRSSGRETAARVAAGAIARLLIPDIRIYAYAIQVGRIKARNTQLDQIENNPVRCADPEAAKKMEQEIIECGKENDSIGGMIEILVKDVPAGLGDPVFGKLEAELSRALMSIGAVKGIEFGAGFSVAGIRGSENNDCISSEGFMSNNAGGILGGISTGQDMVIRIAIKPTPSISREQDTIDDEGKDTSIRIEGRHDPCIVPRVIPVAEAMVAIILADMTLKQRCAR